MRLTSIALGLTAAPSPLAAGIAAVLLTTITGGAATIAGATSAQAAQAAQAPQAAAQAPQAPAARTQALVQHPSLVPERPATGYPMITQAAGKAVPAVGATEQVGRHLVSGGKFTQITLQDGSQVTRPWLAVWNIDTKQLECQNSTIDGQVTAITPGPLPDTVFIGGTFAKLTGPDGALRTRPRLALLKLPDCSIDKTFVPPPPNSVVTDLKLLGNRLFVAGNFTTMGTTSRSYLAEVNATTGSLAPGFSFALSKVRNPAIAGIGVNPSGTRLIAGGNLTGGPTRVIDISDPAAARMTAHSSSGFPRSYVTDAAVSPDGESIALAYAPGAPSAQDDAVSLAPATEAAVTPRWTHAMLDSPFSVAVSNNAVYVGGHFCKPASGPGPTEVMAPWAGTPSKCTGSSIAGGVWRSHLAALSPADGTPLAWNPGNQSSHGATALTVTTRGLLVGFDGERTRSVRTGALSFLDFGPQVEDTTPPSAVTFTAPTPGATLSNPARVSGTATDNAAVATFRLTVTAANGKYLQANGKLTTTPFTFIAQATAGAFSLDLPISVASTYTVSAVAVDTAGTSSAAPATISFIDTAVDTAAPVARITSELSIAAATATTLSGTASDNAGVTSLSVQITDAAGQFVQADGTLAVTPATQAVVTTPAVLPSAKITWSTALSPIAAGTYTVTVTTKDAAGNTATSTSTLIAAVQVTNYARDAAAIASQSSVFTGNAGATLFADGSMDGVFANGTVAHTALQANPFMDLDLGTSRTLSTIRIWNRTDCCADRLDGARVFLSQSPFTSNDPAVTAGQAGVTTLSIGTAGATIDLPVTGSFRYVRLQITSASQYLHVAEIQAIGPAGQPAVINLTRVAGAAVSQSATATGNGGAALFADGKRNGDYTAGSVALTSGSQSWMQVDLGTARTVNTVRLWNRTDAYGTRLSNTKVFLSAAPFTSTDPVGTQNEAGVLTVSIGTAGTSVTLPVSGAYRYVRLQTPSTVTPLNIAEFEVYGPAA